MVAGIPLKLIKLPRHHWGRGLGWGGNQIGQSYFVVIYPDVAWHERTVAMGGIFLYFKIMKTMKFIKSLLLGLPLHYLHVLHGEII